MIEIMILVMTMMMITTMTVMLMIDCAYGIGDDNCVYDDGG